MKLIELLYYMAKYIPIKITKEKTEIYIETTTEQIENLTDKNFKRYILDSEIKKIDYNGEYEIIEIILKEN